MILELTDQNFENTLSSIHGLVIVDFWSPWCRPCNMLNPIIKSLAENNADVSIGKVNTMENQLLARKFNISAVPTILFLKNGNLVKKILGYVKEADLQKYIDELK